MEMIKIKGQNWTIDEVTKREFDARNHKGAVGLCIYDERALLVLNNLSKKMKGTVVAHEIAHAVIAKYDIPFRDANQEEHYVERMDEVIYRVAKVFPEVYK